MPTTIKRILITPGEPAGIGPDITIQAATQPSAHELVVIADPTLLTQRAKQLNIPLTLIDADLSATPKAHQPNTLQIISTPLNTVTIPQQLDTSNADYVLRTLQIAADTCLQHLAHAVVTGPVHKAVINDAGFAFTGHTEFFAHHCGVAHTVMLFVVDQLKVALATTHLPLADVPRAITKERLQLTLTTLTAGLKQQFGLISPRLLVCGLNPHAGEGGHLGREEIDIMTPLFNTLRQEGYHLDGPLPADTLFTPTYLANADAVLAMYHDQALPLIKHIGFGHAINVTLGLPFIRTSVDHGTALNLAGTGKADPGSLQAAIGLAGVLLYC